jgi:hypothetical protein
MLCEYIHFEINFPEEEGRVVVKNDHWVAVVPWWAIWPFEIMGTLFPFLMLFTIALSACAMDSPSTSPPYNIYCTPDHCGEGIIC